MLIRKNKRRNLSIQEALKLEDWVCNNIADEVSDMWDFGGLLAMSEEFKDIEISNEMIEYVYLAALMPYQKILYYIEQYDSSLNIKSDEIQFVLDLKNMFGVNTTNEVIKRIRYVRGLKNWMDKHGKY